MSLKVRQAKQLHGARHSVGWVDNKNITSLLDVSSVYKQEQNNTLNLFNQLPTQQPIKDNKTWFSGKIIRPVNAEMYTLTNYAQAPTGVARGDVLTLISDPVLNKPEKIIIMTNYDSMVEAQLNRQL
tara:strand:+ start:588 stop:968 length:381 start_codon:yes stop_codon:yes gene_type:complete